MEFHLYRVFELHIEAAATCFLHPGWLHLPSLAAFTPHGRPTYSMQHTPIWNHINHMHILLHNTRQSYSEQHICAAP